MGNEGFAVDAFGIAAPFLYKSKADIAKLGQAYGVPWHKTWSCYKGGLYHCGRCGTCVERIEAFHLAGVTENTFYEDVEFWKEATSAG
jgi:7-cyano-7-deazaguanine synthase